MREDPFSYPCRWFIFVSHPTYQILTYAPPLFGNTKFTVVYDRLHFVLSGGLIRLKSREMYTEGKNWYPVPSTSNRAT